MFLITPKPNKIKLNYSYKDQLLGLFNLGVQGPKWWVVKI